MPRSLGHNGNKSAAVERVGVSTRVQARRGLGVWSPSSLHRGTSWEKGQESGAGRRLELQSYGCLCPRVPARPEAGGQAGPRACAGGGRPAAAGLGLPGGSAGTEPAAMQETQVRSLGWGDPLKKGVATHSSILPWRIPWTEQPGRATAHGVAKESDTTGD